MLIEDFGNNTAGVVIDTPPLRDAIVPPVAEVIKGVITPGLTLNITHHGPWPIQAVWDFGGQKQNNNTNIQLTVTL
jgi:hypothetical protein